MTSSNGNIFHVTGPLCGEFTGHSPHKGQWRRVLMFSSIWAWINNWVNNREPGDLRRLCTHYDTSVMTNVCIFLGIGCVKYRVRWTDNRCSTPQELCMPLPQELCTLLMLCCVLSWFGAGKFYSRSLWLLHWRLGNHTFASVSWCSPRVGVTKPISFVPSFSEFSALSKHMSAIENPVYIWQVSLQLSCDSNNLRGTFARLKILLMEKLTNRVLVTPTPVAPFTNMD